jgi:hypothetical protein
VPRVVTFNSCVLAHLFALDYQNSFSVDFVAVFWGDGIKSLALTTEIVLFRLEVDVDDGILEGTFLVLIDGSDG